jgi:uncharacterized protein (DUF433 family)
MNGHGRTITTPDTLFGRPHIAGTRIGVDFILDLVASGWTESRILEDYPHLKPDDLQTVFAFVLDAMKDEGGFKSEAQGRRNREPSYHEGLLVGASDKPPPARAGHCAAQR